MLRRYLAFAVLLTLIATANAAELLDNAGIVRLTRSGLSAEIILLKIEQSEGRFDTSTDALVELKSAGVAETVIKAMMLKAPRLAAPPPASSDTCAKLSFYTLGNNGWEWTPSSVCVSAKQLSVDEQPFSFASLTVQCVEPEARFGILGANGAGEATWRFSDGKESFALRGKPEDIRRLSDALAAAAPAVRHGKCNDSSLRLQRQRR
jgi:hypothetical protein